MSTKQMSQAAARAAESNPLLMMEKGLQVRSDVPRYRRSAVIGNLYFEYVQNVPTLKGVVRSGRQVAEYLEIKNLIEWDRASDRYTWKRDPLTRSAFLQMIRQPESAGNN